MNQQPEQDQKEQTTRRDQRYKLFEFEAMQLRKRNKENLIMKRPRSKTFTVIKEDQRRNINDESLLCSMCETESR
jgi:hypothetical protein